MGVIDYWCNAFTPDRAALWDAVMTEHDLSIKIRRNEDDSFAEPAAMLARMDSLAIETLILPCADVPEAADAFAFERYATGFDAALKLAAEHPGRFAAVWSVDPLLGMGSLRKAREALCHDAFVGLHLHTHSFDRAFDDRSLYPFYALAAEHGVPFTMQAGASGGRMPSECGRPLGVDRPALYFEDVSFVLSHTGWPWIDEAVAMAGKHPNVYLGTAAWPPHHWSPDLVRFMTGLGRHKSLFGTSFPVVGHRHALARLGDLELEDGVRHALLEGTARKIFTRLPEEKTS